MKMNKTQLINFINDMITLVEENREYFLDGFDYDIIEGFKIILKNVKEGK